MKKIISTYWLLLHLIISLTASHAEEQDIPFVFAFQHPKIDNLDNRDATTSVHLVIVSHIMEGIVRVDTANDQQPSLLLAKEHQIIDKLTHVFRLHKALIFHPHFHGSELQNAEAVTAEDVATSIRRASKKDNLLGHVEAMPVTKELLKIKLDKPDPDLLFKLATNLGSVTCKTYYEELGSNEDDRKVKFQKHPIGTGPYRLSGPLQETSETIRLIRFGQYHDQAWVTSGHAPEIVDFHFYDHLDQLAEGLWTGKVQMTSLLLSKLGTGNGFIDVTQGRLPVKRLELNPPFLSLLSIKLEREYLAEPLVRRALNAAVDKELIRRICPELASQQNSALPAGYHSYLEITQQYFEEEEELSDLLQNPGLNQHLKQIPASGLRLRIPESDDPIRYRMMEIVEEGIENNLGIKVTIETRANAKDDGYDLEYSDWVPDTPAGQNELAVLHPLFHSASETSPSSYENSRVNGLLEKVSTVFDDGAKKNLRKRAQQELLRDPPHIWLPNTRTIAIIYQDSYELDSGNSIYIYFTAFLKDLRSQP